MNDLSATEQDGQLEMVQLWVNLPARDKMSTPGSQALLEADFPRLPRCAPRGRG